MAWIAERSPRPWRMALRLASYKGARFHIEAGEQSGGRRIALHEYPKRDQPYAEDMGRRTIGFELTGYLIEGDAVLGQDYRRPRDALLAALNSEGPGILIHPTLRQLKVVCERFSLRENRERGGFCAVDMHFIEYGSPADDVTFDNSTAQVDAAADKSDSQASAQASSGYETGGVHT